MSFLHLGFAEGLEPVLASPRGISGSGQIGPPIRAQDAAWGRSKILVGPDVESDMSFGCGIVGGSRLFKGNRSEKTEIQLAVKVLGP
jgi:hypothetical protein